MSIPAIPTRFRGWRFRSRLEARWAILFSELRIAFHYEMEGIQLPSGTLYLPDFFLPRVRMWAEVKPTDFLPEELQKCRELMQCTNRNCLFLVGPPDFKTYMGTSWDCDNYTETDYLLDVDWHGRKHYDGGRLFGSTDGSWSHPLAFSEPYRNAVYLSRSERFEGAA